MKRSISSAAVAVLFDEIRDLKARLAAFQKKLEKAQQREHEAQIIFRKLNADKRVRGQATMVAWRAARAAADSARQVASLTTPAGISSLLASRAARDAATAARSAVGRARDAKASALQHRDELVEKWARGQKKRATNRLKKASLEVFGEWKGVRYERSRGGGTCKIGRFTIDPHREVREKNPQAYYRWSKARGEVRGLRKNPAKHWAEATSKKRKKAGQARSPKPKRARAPAASPRPASSVC